MFSHLDSTSNNHTNRHSHPLDPRYDHEHEYIEDEDSMFSEEEEDDDIDDELAMVNAGDDIQSYNRWFLQQQQIGQERHQEELIKQATKRRKRIAEAILSGVHLTAASKKSKNASIYSILRGPDGTAVCKIPLEASPTSDNAEKEGLTSKATQPFQGDEGFHSVGSRSA